MQKRSIYTFSGTVLFFVLTCLLILFFIGNSRSNESLGEKIGLNDSLYKKKFELLKEESSKKEGFIVLKAKPENSAAIIISGWSLHIGEEEKNIPLGSSLPYFGEINQLSAIQLLPDDKAIISFLPSPLGVAFKENKCSGYLGEFLNFTPTLPNNCPPPQAESNELGCRTFIERLPLCQNKLESAPSAECKRFVSDNIGYNACITKHKNDGDFFSKTWRIYIPLPPGERDKPITLLDSEGKKVLDIIF